MEANGCLHFARVALNAIQNIIYIIYIDFAYIITYVSQSQFWF